VADGAGAVAVVGLGCRLPGGIGGPEDLWRLLRAGGDVRAAVPQERWAAYESAGPEFAAVLAGTTRWGGFLDDVAGFDAAFFGISPREAAVMDPQQRVLLEVTWEALERAGLPPRRLAGGRAGVFVGVWSDDYGRRLLEDLPRIEAWTGIGTTMGGVAARISHALDLRGPSLAVDTACSSSLVAVHLACQSLRAGECPVALAGGVNLLLSPGMTVALQRAGAIAGDGRCKVFDAEADGYGRSEGCVVLVLERLSDALRDGHPVLAVLRGGAVTQNGRGAGIMAPSAAAQEAAMREACASAGVAPGSVDYVEIHGTGTRLGDVAEAAATGAVFGAGRPGGRPCLVGSVKSKLGHLEAASGVAGLLEVVLALGHGEIPPTAAPVTPAPGVPVRELGLRLVTEPTPWPATGEPRRAGVSSFGFGGTNAHVVVEEPPAAAAVTGAREGWHLVAVSGASEEGLRGNVGRLLGWLGESEAGVGDVAWTLGRRRTHLEHRVSVVAREREELERGLESWLGGEAGWWVSEGRAAKGGGGLVWVFSGQGSQWTGMGRELWEEEGVFRAVVKELEGVYEEELGVSLRRGLCTEELEGAGADVVQPLIYAMQVGLAAVLRIWGVRPSAVMGHSMGEISAAVVGGALSREEGARLVCRRSRLLGRVVGRGGMAMVGVGAEEAERRLEGSGLEVAVSGSGTSTVVTGGVEELEAAMGEWEREGLEVRRVASDVAFHSGQMEGLMEELAGAVELRPGELEVGFYGTVLEDARARPGFDGGYWAENLRRRVRLGEAARAAVADGNVSYLEVSPHPVVARVLEEVLEEAGASGRVGWTLRRGRSAMRSLLGQVGALHCAGREVDWERLEPAGRLVSVPTTAWQHRRHWLEAAPTALLPAPAPVPPVGHALRWRPRPAGGPRTPVGPAPWLLLADRGGVADALATAIRRAGGRCLTVPAGTTPDRLPLAGAGQVVHLGALDRILAHDDPAAAGAARELALDVLGLAGAMAEAGPGRLRLVTRRAQPVGGGPVHPVPAVLWGLGRGLALERPGAWAGLVDLDGDRPEVDARLLLDELTAGGDEDQVAYRDGTRHVARLARAALPAAGAGPTLDAERCHLVAGAGGALAPHVVERLAGLGARHLVLVARRGLRGAAAGTAASLRAAGARVTEVAADVADEAAMRALFARFGADLPRLGGVYHLAMAGGYVELAGMGAGDLADSFRPKVDGGALLHRLSLDHDVQRFVLFSSTTALLGARGLAHYGAANAFLDALAHARAGAGLPALVVNWGAWASGFAEAEYRDLMERSGMRPLDDGTALGVLDGLLAGGSTQHVVADVDWDLLATAYRGRSAARILDELAAPPAAPAEAPLAARLRAVPPAERRRLLLEHVRALVAGVMGFPSAGSLGADQRFFQSGMDSLMSVQVQRRLAGDLGCELPPATVFNYPTAAALADHLLAALPGLAEPPAVAAMAAGEATEDELARRLAERLEALS
jgi:phthiocerol/phenolphthiocerol synthesis type-I polyketide synthase B